MQNGYYLPITSDDRLITFLHKVSAKTPASNRQSKTLGSESPKLRSVDSVSSQLKLDIDKLALESTVDDTDHVFNVRPAVHMDAMAFGMGCCCL